MAKKAVVTDAAGEVQVKTKTLFDHLNGITYAKTPWDTLTPADQKTFEPYMINRFLSMNPDYVTFINDLQQYVLSGLPRSAVYKLYLDILPKVKTYNKYVKSSGDTYSKELIDIITTHYQCSSREAKLYIDTFHKVDLNALKQIIMAYGNSDKVAEKLIAKQNP